MTKCKCGNDIEYSDYDDIQIEDGCFVIRGKVKCDKCDSIYNYEELHNYNYNKKIDVYFEEVNICNYCELTEFGNKDINTNEFNICEGIKCNEALKNLNSR